MVKNKDLKKAIYLLKKYNQTPIEVINYIESKLLSNVDKTSNVNSNIDNTNCDNKNVSFSDYKYGQLLNGINLKYNNNILSKNEFKCLMRNFKEATGEKLNMRYEEFVNVEKLVINREFLNAVKRIKDITSYNLITSKRICDEIRLLHDK